MFTRDATLRVNVTPWMCAVWHAWTNREAGPPRALRASQAAAISKHKAAVANQAKGLGKHTSEVGSPPLHLGHVLRLRHLEALLLQVVPPG